MWWEFTRFLKCWLKKALLMLCYGSFSLSFELHSFGLEKQTWKQDLIVWGDQCSGGSSILTLILGFIRACYQESASTAAFHTQKHVSVRSRYHYNTRMHVCGLQDSLQIHYMNPFDGCRVHVQRTSGRLRCIALHKQHSALLSPTIGRQIRWLGATSAN